MSHYFFVLNKESCSETGSHKTPYLCSLSCLVLYFHSVVSVSYIIKAKVSTKIKSKWIKCLNVKAKTKKLLKENGELHIRLGNDLLHRTQKHRQRKETDYIQIKNFCASKGTATE